MKAKNIKLVETIAQNVRFLMAENRLQTKEFAKRANIESRTLDRLLACEHLTALDTLIQIADYFNVSLDYLTSRTKNVKDLEYEFLAKVIETIITKNYQTSPFKEEK